MTTAKSVEEILARFDAYDPASLENFNEALRQARSTCPVAPSAAYGGYHMITRYDDVRTVCQRPDVFSSRDPSPTGPMPVRMIPLDSDLPEHRGYRQLLNPYFSRSYLLRHESEMRRIAREAIGQFLDRGAMDAVEQYAGPFTAGALAHIVLSTSDQDLLDRAIAVAERLAAPDQNDEDQRNLAAVALEAIQQVAADPEPQESVVSALNTHLVNGIPLTFEEKLGIISVLISGGLDTTKGMIAGILYHVATNPGLEEKLRSPDWSRTMLDEFLRVESTVAVMARTVTQDFELNGTKLTAGDRVVLNFSSANRDESRFSDPDRLDFDRPGDAHAAFGLGIHRCLGSNFARIQLSIAIDELLAQISNIRLDPAGAVRREAGLTFNAIKALPLLFDRRPTE
jgi:cytochrome P450